ARRELSPAGGSDRKVAITNSPSGNAPIGPRSIARGLLRVNAGMTAAPIAGSATPVATKPPRPRVARSRSLLRGNLSASPAAGSLLAGSAHGRDPLPLPRNQAIAASTVIATPAGATTSRLTIRPA